MARAYADRVKETTTTTGTGTYDLAGAETGFQTFVAGVGTTNTCFYCATDGTDWEVGLGTVTDATPDTLSRTTILASSNGGAAVNWGAGSKDVFLTQPASKLYSNDLGQTESEAFGAGASLTGQNSVAVGKGATARTDSVAVGHESQATEATGQAVAIGRSTNVSGRGSIGLGYNCDIAVNNAILIGRFAGVGVAAPQANECVIANGSEGGINEFFAGLGRLATAPTNVRWNGTGGSGTDIAGGDLRIAGGKGTGSGVGGSVVIQVAPAGTTGTTLGTLEDAAEFDTDDTSGNTRLLLYDAVTGSTQRVKVGANGSGPSATGRALFIDDSP